MTTTAALTLTDFLLARIAEDEAAAQAIIDRTSIRRWRAGEDGDGWAIEDADDENMCVTCNDSGGNELDRVEAVHMARHDPARVLAECEAKRRIVERCKFSESHPDWEFQNDVGEYWELANDTLRDLAAVYADHPDYREDWRVG